MQFNLARLTAQAAGSLGSAASVTSNKPVLDRTLGNNAGCRVTHGLQWELGCKGALKNRLQGGNAEDAKVSSNQR